MTQSGHTALGFWPLMVIKTQYVPKYDATNHTVDTVLLLPQMHEKPA